MHATGLIKGLDPKEYRSRWHLKNRKRRLAAAKSNYAAHKARWPGYAKTAKAKDPNRNQRYSKAYRERHPEKAKAIQAAWRERNRESERERGRKKGKLAYAHPIKRAEILRKNREWARANKTRITAKSAKRHALKKGATLGDTKLIAEWMRHVRSLKFVRCHWCGTKVPGQDVHFDHVIALNKKGSHSIGNLCASCPECNLSKQDRDLSEWVKKAQLFLPI